MKVFTSLILAILTFAANQAFAQADVIRASEVSEVSEGIKKIAACKNYLKEKKSIFQTRNSVGNHEFHIQALGFKNQVVVQNRENIGVLMADSGIIEFRDNSKLSTSPEPESRPLKGTIDFSKDQTQFINELDNFEQIIADALDAAKEVEPTEYRSQEKINAYIEEITCASEIIKLTKKQYSKD